jgi:exopolysaccharide production protein ExoY
MQHERLRVTRNATVVQIPPIQLDDPAVALSAFNWPVRRSLRVLDLAGAIGLLVFVSPLFAAIYLLIRLQNDGPVFFVQNRIGYGGRQFRCLKFRTMVSDADGRLANLLASDKTAYIEWLTHQKLRRDPRVTRIGAFLRKSSLDELPQLINVLRGEMSLVGPRPIVTDEVRRYGARISYYLSVLPGITGLWQISGRNDVSYRRRVACDVLYARRRSLVLNIMILLLTVPMVLMRRGSY